MEKVTNIEEATHWIPTDATTTQYSRVTVGKPYLIHVNPKDGEYYILDDDGIYSLAFLCFHGYFVKNSDNDDKKYALSLLINQALDERNKELFMKLTDEYKKIKSMH